MRGHQKALLVLGGVALLVAGCGSSGPIASDQTIARPSTPQTEECTHKLPPRTAGRNDRPAPTDESPPEPGAYLYEVKGTQAIPGQALRVKNLPHRSELVVTPARKIKRGSCFRVQMRVSPDLAITRTYVIQGEDIYLASLVTQAFGESQEIRPSPPVLSATNSGSKWSGQFGGPTYGAYTFSGLGKRIFRVGQARIRAVGISSSVSYRGAFIGRQVATAWIAIQEKLIVAERLRSRQEFGATTLKVRSSSHLVSLSGEPWTSHE
jgi:hypothetical protein